MGDFDTSPIHISRENLFSPAPRSVTGHESASTVFEITHEIGHRTLGGFGDVAPVLNTISINLSSTTSASRLTGDAVLFIIQTDGEGNEETAKKRKTAWEKLLIGEAQRKSTTRRVEVCTVQTLFGTNWTKEKENLKAGKYVSLVILDDRSDHPFSKLVDYTFNFGGEEQSLLELIEIGSNGKHLSSPLTVAILSSFNFGSTRDELEKEFHDLTYHTGDEQPRARINLLLPLSQAGEAFKFAFEMAACFVLSKHYFSPFEQLSVLISEAQTEVMRRSIRRIKEGGREPAKSHLRTAAMANSSFVLLCTTETQNPEIEGGFDFGNPPVRASLQKIPEIHELYKLAKQRNFLTYQECMKFEEIGKNMTKLMIFYTNCCDKFRKRHQRILFSLNMAMFYISELDLSDPEHDIHAFPRFSEEELRPLWDRFAQSETSLLEVYKTQGESTRRLTKQIYNCLYGQKGRVFGPGFFQHVLEATASFDTAELDSEDGPLDLWEFDLEEYGYGGVEESLAHPNTFHLAWLQDDFLKLLNDLHNYGHKHLYKRPHADIGFDDKTQFLFKHRSEVDVVGFEELDRLVFKKIDAVLSELGDVEFCEPVPNQTALTEWKLEFREAVSNKLGEMRE